MKKLIAGLLMLSGIEISLALYLTFWREHFWAAVAAHEYVAFTQQIMVFTGVALAIGVVAGLSGYLLTLTAIKWRQKLNAKAHSLEHDENVLNTPQRIQEDCCAYPTLVLNLTFGWVKALVYIVVFSISLLLSFSWLYLLILIGYAIVATLITSYVAKPLIKLNYDTQQAEASYRSNLSIDNFDSCVRILLGIARKQKHLTYTQSFLSQVGVVIPLLIIAPLYFTTNMPIGLLMRFNSTAATVLENMNYGMSSFEMLNRLLACRRRLKEIYVI